MRCVRAAAAARSANGSRAGPSSPSQTSSSPNASAARMVSTMVCAGASGKNQTPRRTAAIRPGAASRSARHGAARVAGRNFGLQAQAVGNPVDVVEVADDVVQVEDVEIVQAHLAQLLDIGLLHAIGPTREFFRVFGDGIEPLIGFAEVPEVV